MDFVQFKSDEDPFRDPELSAAAHEAVRRGEAMGLLEAEEFAEPPGWQLIRRLHDRMIRLGIGRRQLLDDREVEPENLRLLLRRINQALEGSPVPSREWPRLVAVFGTQQLSELLNLSPASVQRYQKGIRRTPDDVAARLHFLALLVGHLAGAYNEIGIRRWFDRKREQLSGQTPAETLGRDWNPDAEGPARVRQLAESLASSPAT